MLHIQIICRSGSITFYPLLGFQLWRFLPVFPSYLFSPVIPDINHSQAFVLMPCRAGATW